MRQLNQQLALALNQVRMANVEKAHPVFLITCQATDGHQLCQVGEEVSFQAVVRMSIVQTF